MFSAGLWLRELNSNSHNFVTNLGYKIEWFGMWVRVVIHKRLQKVCVHNITKAWKNAQVVESVPYTWSGCEQGGKEALAKGFCLDPC